MSGRRLSLALRLDLWYAAVFAASFVLLLLALERIADASFGARERRMIERELLERAAHWPGDPTAPTFSAECPLALAWYVRVSTARDQTLWESDASTVRGADDEVRSPPSELAWRRRLTRDLRMITVGAVQVAPDRVLEVGLGDEMRRALVQDVRTAAVWTAAIAIVIAALGGAFVARRALAPLRALTATAQSVVRSGDLSARVPVRSSRDELDELGTLFNQMLARNQTLVSGMRGALDDVAHDLRTPLTRLRSSAELALRSGDEGSARSALADVVEESDRVLAMLRALMDVSEAEAGVMRLELENVAVGELVDDVVDLYAHVADENGVAITAEHGPGLVVRGDRVRLRQALANLVDNAVKYTPRGGRVQVRAARAGQCVQIVVEDSGMGIAPEDLDRIWDRLYRADRSRAQRGLGLGLSFVRAIVRAHGGTVEVASEPGRGSRFTMLLPASA